MIVLVTSRLCFQEGESHSRDLLQALRKLREALVYEVVSIHHSRWLSTVWVAPLTGGHLGARQGQQNGIEFKSPTQSPMTPMEISTDIYKTRALQQYFSVYWMDQTMPGCVGDSDGGECVLLLICCHWPTLRPTRHTWESCSGSTLEPSPAQPSPPSPPIRGPPQINWNDHNSSTVATAEPGHDECNVATRTVNKPSRFTVPIFESNY